MYQLQRYFDNSTPSSGPKEVNEVVADSVRQELEALKAEIWDKDKHISETERDQVLANVIKKQEANTEFQNSLKGLRTKLDAMATNGEREEALLEMAGGPENVLLWMQALRYDVESEGRKVELDERMHKRALSQALTLTLKNESYQKNLYDILEQNELEGEEQLMVASLLATNDIVANDPDLASKYLDSRRESIREHKPLVGRMFEEYGDIMMEAGFAGDPEKFNAQAAIDAAILPIMKSQEAQGSKDQDPQALQEEQQQVSQALALAQGKTGGIGGVLSSLNFMKARESQPMSDYERLKMTLGATFEADIHSRLENFIKATDGQPPEAFEKYHQDIDVSHFSLDEQGRPEFGDEATEAEKQFIKDLMDSVPPGWHGTKEEKEYLSLVVGGVDINGDGNYEPYRKDFMTWIDQEDKASSFTKLWRSVYGFFKGMKSNLAGVPFIGDMFKDMVEEEEAERMSESMAEWSKMTPTEKQAVKKEIEDESRRQEMVEKTQELINQGTVSLSPSEGVGYMSELNNEQLQTWETLIGYAGQDSRVWGTALKKDFELTKLIAVHDQTQRMGLKLLEQPIQTAKGGMETPFVIDYPDQEPQSVSWEELKKGARQLRMTGLEQDMAKRPEAWAGFLGQLEDDSKYTDYVHKVDSSLEIDWDNLDRNAVLGQCMYMVMKLESLKYVHNLLENDYMTPDPKGRSGETEIDGFNLKLDIDGQLTDKDPGGEEYVRVLSLDWSEIESHTEDLPSLISQKLEAAQRVAEARKADMEFVDSYKKSEAYKIGGKFEIEDDYSGFKTGRVQVKRLEGDTWSIEKGPFAGQVEYENFEEALIATALIDRSFSRISNAGWDPYSRSADGFDIDWYHTDGIEWDSNGWGNDIWIVNGAEVKAISEFTEGRFNQQRLITILRSVFTVASGYNAIQREGKGLPKAA